MSTLAPERLFSTGLHGRAGAARSLLDQMDGEPTLDEFLTGVWEGLAAHRSVSCLVCGGEMAPGYAAHARPVGGRCQRCHTTLT